MSKKHGSSYQVVEAHNVCFLCISTPGYLNLVSAKKPLLLPLIPRLTRPHEVLSKQSPERLRVENVACDKLQRFGTAHASLEFAPRGIGNMCGILGTRQYFLHSFGEIMECLVAQNRRWVDMYYLRYGVLQTLNSHPTQPQTRGRSRRGRQGVRDCYRSNLIARSCIGCLLWR